MLEAILRDLSSHITPQLLVELLITFFFVVIVVYIFKSDLVRNESKVVDANEEKRKRTIENLKKSSKRANERQNLKDKLNSEGRG